jgi:aminoglycoside phosphotransferase (APT) family kinase protein
MSDFISTMQMHPQETPQSVVEHERSLVAAELGLTESDAASRIGFSDEGWSSRVYLLDGGETVFKFPRSTEVTNDYGREIAALLLLDTVECPLPTQRFRATGPSGGFSYHGLVGTQLSEQLDVLSLEDKTAIGSQIGSFLTHMHGLELPDVPRVTIGQEVQEYQAKYQLALPVIETLFTDSEQASVAKFFWDQLPAEVERLDATIKLCHGDLGSYNVVVTADGTPGIIDFGNVGYYDTSKDFIDFGDAAVLEAALASYGDNPVLRAKISVRTIALQAIDLVYYMSKKDRIGVDKTADKLRSLLLEQPNKFGDYPE